MRQRDAAFPRVVDLFLRDAPFRCLVVLVLALDGTVHGYQALLLAATCFGQHFIEVDFIARNPSAVQPQDVELAVVLHQFVQLVLREVLVLLPPVGMLVTLVVLHTVRSGVVVVPEPLAVPVGLREVAANHEVLLAESVEHVAGHVLAWILGKRAVGDGEVGVFRVEHAEAVVVLGGEDHVFHTGILHHVRPLFRIELRGVEGAGEAPVPVLVALVRKFVGTCDPVLRAEGPRFADAGYGVQSPVEQYAEFLVLPLV